MLISVNKRHDSVFKTGFFPQLMDDSLSKPARMPPLRCSRSTLRKKKLLRSTRITCAYDQNGLRLSKDVNGVKHEYLYASGTLLREVITGTDNAVQTLDFFYDQSGRPYALNYTAGGTTTTYYYITNLQGDVLHLITSDGTATASYTYNPYGTVLTSTGNMAAVNPLRYRGYYYDSETGFYYVSSRYYDAYTGRFINADEFVATGQGFGGNNMFAYCGNNPVMYIDIEGNIPESPPLIENGLNLPASGGIPIVIDGIMYYYAISYSPKGELYEYWFDVDGNLVHVRHHSTHGNAKEHHNPHDHDGTKDDEGNNTFIHKTLPVDDKFQQPDQLLIPQDNFETIGTVATGIVAGYAVYQIAKWILATFLLPSTGGTSYILAASTP